LEQIGQYLVYNFYFGPPYLAAYGLVYGLGYWLLARTGREHATFWLLAALAGLYWMLNLRELVALRGALVTINCLGLFVLLGRMLGQRPLLWPAHLALVVLPVPFWMLLARQSDAFAHPDPSFVLVVSLGLTFHVLAYALARHGQSFRDISWFLSFFLLAFVLLSLRHSPKSDNYNYVLVCGLTAGRYVLGELAICGLLFLAWLAIARRFPRTSRAGFDLMAGTLLLLAILDLGMAFRWGSAWIGTRWSWRTISGYCGAPFNPLLAGLRQVFSLFGWLTGVLRISPNAAPGGILSPADSEH
jgi:hypothetical protein